MAKRLFDLLAAAAGLIVLAPVLGLVALLVRLDTPGPVFYRAERVGRGGAPFGMYKFRTMVVGADRLGPLLTRGRDPRVTRVGRILRHWKLDELPQLLNVLCGEMSVVGPRPESACYVARYSPEQRRVLQVRPGITGLAQVRFRHEEALLQGCKNLEEAYIAEILPRKLTLDLQYVDKQSLGLDIGLIAKTLACLVERDGQSR